VFLGHPFLLGAADRGIKLDQDLALPDVLPVADVDAPDDPSVEGLDDLGMVARNQLPSSHRHEIDRAEGRPADGHDEQQNDDPHHGLAYG